MDKAWGLREFDDWTDQQSKKARNGVEQRVARILKILDGGPQSRYQIVNRLDVRIEEADEALELAASSGAISTICAGSGEDDTFYQLVGPSQELADLCQ